MRGSPFKLAVGAVLAATLLASCTSKASSVGSGVVASVSSAAVTSAPGSPIVTVPPVSSAPVVQTPSTPVTGATITTPTTISSLASTSTPAPTTTKVVIPAATYAASPGLGSSGLSPRTPITVRVSHGTLAGLVLRNADGDSVRGSLSADRKSWTLGEPLGYDATYQLAGEAVGANGKSVKIDGSYSTISPDGVISASISPGDGDTVGIGAPILISLGTDIQDTTGRQNIEKAITVTTVPKTEGSFAWIQHDDGWGLDWRPKAYWKPGTKVTVTANLYGVSYGNNMWGKDDVTSSFTIGRSEITKGDVKSHRLKVYRDGKLLFDFPTSFGLESDPGRVTRGGTYIVMSKEYLHLMSNPTYHYTNFKAYYAVRISNSGVFIHANDGTADVQGSDNVTHGCANLTTANAKAFYDQTMYGDPVEITGSSIAASGSEGDVYDWTIPWDKWQTLSALSKAYAG